VLSPQQPLPRRLVQLIAGLLLLGVGIAFQVRARLGLGPWDVLHQGISRHTGIEIGTVGILVGIPIVLLWWPLRQRPGIGTLLNLVLVGLTTDVVLGVTSDAHAALLRWVLLVVSLGLIALGQGLYLSVELGAGPRDGVMTGLHRRVGWSIRVARTLMESCALVAGVILGGTAGIGTVAMALGIGPMVQVTLRWFGFPTDRVEELGRRPADALGLAGE
jgi:uncharacterized membrane protein YczE